MSEMHDAASPDDSALAGIPSYKGVPPIYIY